MKLRKCQIKDGELLVEWTDENDPDKRKCNIESGDKPLPSFDAALSKVTEVIQRATVLPKGWMTKQKCRTTSITVRNLEDGGRSVSLVARAETTNGLGLVLQLQLGRIDEAEDGAKPSAPDVCPSDATILASFIHEAEAYADGDRSQQTFLEDNDPEPTEPGEQLPLD